MKSAFGGTFGLTTVIVWLEVEDAPELSVTTNCTTKVP